GGEGLTWKDGLDICGRGHPHAAPDVGTGPTLVGRLYLVAGPRRVELRRHAGCDRARADPPGSRRERPCGRGHLAGRGRTADHRRTVRRPTRRTCRHAPAPVGHLSSAVRLVRLALYRELTRL